MALYNQFPKRRSTPLFSNVLLMSVLCLSAVPLRSQEKKDKKAVDENDVIRVSSNLVSVDVVVRDKKGRAITNLEAEDFTIYENGVQQKIEFFDSTLASGNDAGQPTAVTNGTGPGRAPRQPNDLPRNIISLVLDGQTTEAANLKHVRDGIIKYIRERTSADDSLALFSIGGGLQLLQPFTQDKAKLISAVEKAYGSSTVSKTSETASLNESISTLRDQLSGASTDSPGTPGSASGAAAAGAAGSSAAQAAIAQRVLEQYIQLRSALSVQQARPVLAALAAICEGLRSIPGKKTLVMFSQGFVAPQALDWQVQSTIDIANRANVAIYIIDPSGLTGGTPRSGALVPGSTLSSISALTNQESRIRSGAGESVFDISGQEGLNRQQDFLYRVSGDTGGQFIKNTNDIAAGLDRVDSEIRSRYTLAYRTTEPTFDGSFRKLKIEVRRPEATVISRAGYYAIPPTQIVPLSPEHKRLLADFETLAARPTLPLSVELTPFRASVGNYLVPLSFEIPTKAVEFSRNGDKRRLQLEIFGVIKAETGEQILSRLGGDFDVELTAQQYESILKDNIFYRQDVELEAGNYTVDLFVKDRLSGKGAARRERLVLPALDSEFSVTKAVLSRRAEPMRNSAGGAPDELSIGSVQIRPSPTREFHNTDSLIIFFKLYNATAARDTGKPLVMVTVTLMKNGTLATKPFDYQLSELQSAPLPHLTFAKYIKLAGLPSGEYSAIIQSRDKVQNRELNQAITFTIVP